MTKKAPLNFLLFSEMVRVNHRFNRFIDIFLITTVISRPEYTVLYLIDVLPGTTQQSIATKMNCSHVAARRHIASLERSGMIGRQRSKTDQRTWQLFPTNKGKAVLARFAELFKTKTQPIFESLTRPDILQISLRELDSALKKQEQALRMSSSISRDE